MKQKKETAGKGHYITNNENFLMDYHLYQKEKMELWIQLFQFRKILHETKSLHINGNKKCWGNHFVHEENTYMADFIVNEKDEIEAVVWDYVSVEQGGKVSD